MNSCLDLQCCRDWVFNNYHVIADEFTQAIGLEKNGKIVSVTGYNHFNGKSCHVHFYHSGGYVSRHYIWLVHHYPFIQCGLDVMIAIVASSNQKIIRLARHLGYILQHTLAEAHPEGDLLILTLRKQDCRFLGV